MSSHLKRKFLKKWFFSSNIIKTPRSSRDRAEKKEKKRKRKKKEKEEEKEKLQESLQIKGKSIFWEEKNTSIAYILFWCDFPPFIIPF
jgi:hypothetical protein